MGLINKEFIPISNSEAWDFYLENLKLREQIKELNIELSLTKNPIYCEDCGSCGENGCCPPTKCKYLESHQGEYDDLVKENEKLREQVEKMRPIYTVINDNFPEIPPNDFTC